MRSWLARLLGREPAPAPRRRPEAAPPAAAPAAPAEAPPAEGLDGAFAPFAQVLGVAPASPRPLAPGEEEEDLRVAGLVLEHFQRNRPGPASAPSLSLQILSLVANPRTGAADLARLVQNDPALSASLLHVANSAYHQGLQEVESVRDAVARIGVEEAGRVAGALAAKSLFSARARQEYAAFAERHDALFRRSAAVAAVSASLAMRAPGARSDRAYLGGMLLDVGKAVGLRSLSALRLDGRVALEPDDPRVDRVLERVHLEIGGEVHQEWNLPQYLTVLCVRHHDDEVPGDPDFRDLHVVRLVSALEDLRRGPAGAPHAFAEVVQSAAVLRVAPHAARALSAELRTAEERVARTFGAGAPPPRPR